FDLQVDEFTLKLFNLHAFSTNEEIEEYFKSLNFQADRTDFFIKQSWRRNESALKVVNDSERENLVDFHWKLVARAGGTEDEKLYVQVELVVERNEQLKKYNLELDIPKFYNLLQELTKANHSLQEIFRR
ncbi:COMM domain-containing protein 7, partial [Armadillidium nasatum]